MAERILMTPDELIEGASFLTSRLEAINSETESLKRKIDDIASRWEGAAKEAFVGRFDGEIYPMMQKDLPEVITGLSQALQNTAETVRDTDAKLASSFSG